MKYKNGDLVEIIKEGSHQLKIGQIVEVLKVFKDDRPTSYLCGDNESGDFWSVKETQIKLHETRKSYSREELKNALEKVWVMKYPNQDLIELFKMPDSYERKVFEAYFEKNYPK